MNPDGSIPVREQGQKDYAALPDWQMQQGRDAVNRTLEEFRKGEVQK